MIANPPARAGFGGRTDMGMYEYDSRTGGTAASLAYDNAGNLTADGDKEYHYDVLGRLTLVESGLNSNVKLAAYRYDGLGRLAMQVTYDYTHDPNDDDLYAASNVTKYYYYDTPAAGGDGASSPVLPQVVEIKDGSGDTTDQFVWGPAYVDELLLHERDADGDPNNVLDQRLYAAHDTLYSVLQLVDEDGSVVEQYSYSPYGADPTDPRKGAARITDGDENELTPEDSVAEYLYTGRQFDKTIGLNYHRARRLSHNLGRWTRRDPRGVDAPIAASVAPPEQYRDGASVYQYTGSHPLLWGDPSGMQSDLPKLECIGARAWADYDLVKWTKKGLGRFGGGCFKVTLGSALGKVESKIRDTIQATLKTYFPIEGDTCPGGKRCIPRYWLYVKLKPFRKVATAVEGKCQITAEVDIFLQGTVWTGCCK